ncbi:hypothetical protein DAA51_10640 [Bradyrhizobium sp. WBAH10]|nr:hypothetical protein [Bradyrhizobium sp. WBAH30]MDD1541910.1 hypothetical protein [Bradyrhizobium sp. WBAH41]MDD1555224.1 hypothetical protein [Bradyrhizobium sp. WBAH23]MDD1564055.1 hypothetical protein [Bradyrhizobium sp. WBAH33]MDD1587649.1 hypothetical protein [Bradyrhizobium sp. WBAH42]NRB87379.1 hypothetical protein [Bradyrhizobium sp. WBAH10]QCJ88923.1 hypothetical protein DAA57_10730 [Bradyrhizobium yuanmingense]
MHLIQYATLKSLETICCSSKFRSRNRNVNRREIARHLADVQKYAFEESKLLQQARTFLNEAQTIQAVDLNRNGSTDTYPCSRGVVDNSSSVLIRCWQNGGRLGCPENRSWIDEPRRTVPVHPIGKVLVRFITCRI